MHPPPKVVSEYYNSSRITPSNSIAAIHANMRRDDALLSGGSKHRTVDAGREYP